MLTLSLPDVDLHYDVHGDGPPFLFMSQTATSGGYWKPFQVPEFSRDHRVIIYDQRGTGRSPTRSADFSTKRLAEDAAALLEHLGVRRAIVCGHSNGGRVAQALTLDHPESGRPADPGLVRGNSPQPRHPHQDVRRTGREGL